MIDTGGQGLLDAALLQQIDQLEQFRPGARAELVDLYLDSSRRDLARCAAALAAGDGAALRAAAHSLKGSSAGIGAMPLSREAGRLEALAVQSDTEAAAAALEALRALHVRVHHALMAWRGAA